MRHRQRQGEAVLGDCLTVAGTVDPAKAFGDGEFEYIDLGAIDQQTKAIRRPVRIDGTGAPSRARQVIANGDILVSTVRPNLNAVARVGHDLDGAIASTGFCVLRPTARVDGGYLFHWVRSPRFVAAMVRRATGASYPAVSDRIVRESTFPLPALSEQRRIARVLDACDLLRRKRQHTIEVSGELVQALFAETSVKHGDPATMPLAELVASDRPITYGILKPGPHVPHGVPYVRVLDIQDGEIRAQAARRTTPEIAAEYRRSVLISGDLVMSIRGHVGRLAVIPEELAGGNITQDSARLAIRNYDARYVMEAIRSAPVQAWMRRRIKGVAVQGINLADVKMIPIPQLSIGVQREFSAWAAGCDRVLARARAQLRHLDALFASLQHRAFTGAL